MNNSIELLQQFLQSLRWIDYTVISVNFLLIAFAKPLLLRLSSGALPESAINFRTNLLRGLNVFILLVYAYQYLYLPAEETGSNITLLSILAILYLTYLANSILQFFVQKQYGKPRQIGEKIHYIQTYQTRLLSILAAILLTIIALVSIVKQLGFDSLLEAGGVLGILGVMLGLTQASWAPDIISGLIILNSDMFEEGDIVDLSDGIVGRVYKTKLFHTEILNLSNNHRIMIRNAHLRDKVIHNLSKFASARGLRECLHFKIGYDTPSSEIRRMFKDAYETALQNDILSENGVDPEVKILDTGDHAVEWGFIFHVKNVESIIGLRREIREIIYEASLKHNISLATPLTYNKL